jgi:hypothetical protein
MARCSLGACSELHSNSYNIANVPPYREPQIPMNSLDERKFLPGLSLPRFSTMLTVSQLALACTFGYVHLAVARSVVPRAAEPKEFQFNARGGDAVHGGTNSTTWPKFVESPRFRFFFKPASQPGVEGRAKTALKHLEASYECFTDAMGWTSSGISYNGTQDQGPYYKLNGFAVTRPSEIGGAGGVMGSDRRTGHAFLQVYHPRLYAPLTTCSYVIHNSVADPGTTVHEYGHAMTYYERNWVEQGNTGTWYGHRS